MTAEGFSPGDVTVDTSSVVTFVNKDAAPHWPASHPHPRHDEYPEFDPTQPIPPGDLWIFQPTKAGTWKYHDHLNHTRRGVLQVEAEKEPRPISWQQRLHNWLQSFFALFRRKATATPAALSATDFRALEEKKQLDQLEQLAQAKGGANAWQFVKESYTAANQSSLGGRAHDLAHFVGGIIFNQQGLAGISLCDPTFAFGCYHGFTEAAFANSLDALQPLAQVCLQVGQEGTGPWSSCIHGIGHGVATYFESQELAPALTTCDQLGAGATFCHDGVFMELAISAPPSLYNQQEPLALCRGVAPAYQPACGRNILAAMQSRFKLPAVQVARECLAAKAAFTESCLDSLGFSIANAVSSNPQQIIDGCGQLEEPTAVSQCAGAAAGELVFQNYPNWQTAAPAICQALTLQFQSSCHQRVQQTIQQYQRQ